jgi:hypothetical protein
MNRLITICSRIYFLDLTRISFSTTIFRYAVVNVALFLTPLVFDQPQIIVGSMVNFLLIYIALNFRKAQLLPAIFLPSLAAVLRGSLLGSLTPSLIMLMPFIWISNAVLIGAIRALVFKNIGLKGSLFISALLKSLALLMMSFVVIKGMNLNEALLIAMGPIQLLTATIGGIIYLVVHLAEKGIIASGK